jgi:hypothetical protein
MGSSTLNQEVKLRKHETEKLIREKTRNKLKKQLEHNKQTTEIEKNKQKILDRQMNHQKNKMNEIIKSFEQLKIKNKKYKT